MLIEVHYRKVSSSIVSQINALGIEERCRANNVTKGERVLINTDKIEVVSENEYSNRVCADVLLDGRNTFELYESMNDIIAMTSCVRSFE